MIKFENVEVIGINHAVRGMRNPMNSWDRADSPSCDKGAVGDADYILMKKLAKGGPVHAKYRRMMVVYVDITAPLYWWKEFDTYKVGTVANSCSTMHKIQEKEFTIADFSHEHLLTTGDEGVFLGDWVPFYVLEHIINVLNRQRDRFLDTEDKQYWWQMIQLLPSSYNQKRTIMLNYEVLTNIYGSRQYHKLDEWHTLCDWIEDLPYSDIITGRSREI